MDRQLMFVLGGARSGKSTYAQEWAQQHGREVLFVATAQAYDDDMRQRIARHRNDRPAHWHTLEVPLNVADAIRAQTLPHDTVVIDCLTLLASNVLLSLPEDADQDTVNAAVLAEVDALLSAYATSSASWLIVSNEVGMSVVPPTRLGNLFRDALGRANQRLASQSDQVVLLVAGLPWYLKGAPTER
jgi:adenosylcobinamide kinase / adenosylcobinamide-phosphate guanylyltransferase